MYTYEDRLDAFVEAANRALLSAYPKPQDNSRPRYCKVSALLIQWEEDDLGVFTELEKLHDILEKVYGYECGKIFKIPEDDSETALFTRIQLFIKNAAPDELLIVYYGGHSDDSHPEHSVWRR